MSWRALAWGAALLACALLAGSLRLAVGSLNALVRGGGRPAWRVLGTLLGLAVAGACAYALWFAWPVFTGRRPAPADPVMAKTLGEPVTRPGLSILVAVAHPDDAEWYCGGTLARAVAAGSRVTVIVATNGEAGRGAATPSELAAIRRREQEEAARIIGYARTVFLELPDRGVSRAADLGDRIASVWGEVEPDVVLTFDARSPARPYIHPDHQAVGRAVADLVEKGGVRPATLYLFSSSRPNATVDITQFAEKKIAAIRAHTSQFGAGRPGGMERAEMFRVFALTPGVAE